MNAHISGSGTRANGIIPTKIVNDTRTTASARRRSRRLAISGAQAAEADLPVTAQAAAGTSVVAGTAANDTIDAGHGGSILFGGAGADTFVFGPSIQLNTTPAQITHVADYSATQGDTFDFGVDLGIPQLKRERFAGSARRGGRQRQVRDAAGRSYRSDGPSLSSELG
jgi:Ca2+-binding RTX toxin-like protein